MGWFSSKTPVELDPAPKAPPPLECLIVTKIPAVNETQARYLQLELQQAVGLATARLVLPENATTAIYLHRPFPLAIQP